MQSNKKYAGFAMWCFVAALLCCACARDLGNYEYSDLPEPSVAGLEDMRVLVFDRLQIEPEISGGLPSDDYDYEWKVIDRNNDNETTVLGNQRNLDIEVTLSPGLYSLYYTLTEKASGVYWQTVVSLTVDTPMSEGWMVLCSDGGRARLDFIPAAGGDILRDVLKDNGMPSMNGPRKIHWQSTMTYTDSPFYLFTDEGATRLGKDAFEWKPEYAMVYEMGTGEVPYPHSMVSSGFGRMFVSGTDAYYAEYLSIMGLYGSPVNKNFAVSPYIGVNVLATEIYAALYLLYDIDAKRFIAYCPMLALNDLGGQETVWDMDGMEQVAGSLAKDGETLVTGNAFSSYPTGYDLVYMESTRYDPGSSYLGIIYSILSDGEGGCFVYGIQLGDMLRFSQCKSVIGRAAFKNLSSCRDILAEGNCYAFSSLKNCMYYSVGGTVYKVDMSAENPQLQLQFTLPGETITCMKFNLYKSSANLNKSYDLVVASVSGESGKLRIYAGYDSDGEFSEVKPEVYVGFPEIADVTYKEKVY